VGILMSGGIDSPTLAATACKLVPAPSTQIRAFTTVFDKLIPDQERYFSGLVGGALGISVEYRVRDDEVFEPDWFKRNLRTPEPVSDALCLSSSWRYYERLRSFSRVFLHGEGPDNALHFEWKPYLSWCTRNRQYGRILTSVFEHIIAHRRPPFFDSLMHKVQNRFRTTSRDDTTFPTWMNEEIVTRLFLKQRWEHWLSDCEISHPLRPRGYQSLFIPQWQSLFEAYDPSGTKVALEFRHPYLDLRVLRFFLAVPALPWCRRKLLLRRVMAGVLPPECLRRSKSRVSGSPTLQAFRMLDGHFPPLDLAMERWVNPSRVPRAPFDGQVQFWDAVRVHALRFWLATVATSPWPKSMARAVASNLSHPATVN
jgi:asparagine synthase (glutamine-hydrolysing)